MTAEPDARSDRRTLFARLAAWFMAGGLVSAYGACGAIAARYLYPARARERRWQFLARASDVPLGASLEFRAPSGEGIAVARRSQTGDARDFVALSFTCPHLGCKVHWEPQNERFFCPCHNGAFDPEGRATAGPPYEAGQSLSRYALKLEAGVVYIEVPMEPLPGAREGSP